jgi:hypothetical protein
MRAADRSLGQGGFRKVLAVLALVACAMVLPAQSPEGTMLSPRSRADYERHLAELNKQYGPDQDQALKEAVLKANQLPERVLTGPGLGGVRLPAGIHPGQLIKVELLPYGSDQYLLQDEVHDSESLSLALAEVQKVYTLSSVLLVEDPDHPILVDHLLGLARIGRALGVPTAYRQGQVEQVLTVQ